MKESKKKLLEVQWILIGSKQGNIMMFMDCDCRATRENHSTRAITYIVSKRNISNVLFLSTHTHTN